MAKVRYLGGDSKPPKPDRPDSWDDDYRFMDLASG